MPVIMLISTQKSSRSGRLNPQGQTTGGTRHGLRGRIPDAGEEGAAGGLQADGPPGRAGLEGARRAGLRRMPARRRVLWRGDFVPAGGAAAGRRAGGVLLGGLSFAPEAR